VLSFVPVRPKINAKLTLLTVFLATFIPDNLINYLFKLLGPIL
jgi:hypothetical protein